jgi:hypothetical protein
MKRQIVVNSSTGISHAMMPGACPLASNGKRPKIPTYSGNSNFLPGTKGFNYKKAWF